MAVKYTLTANEAKVLTALGPYKTILPELAVVTRLTPTEVYGAVSSLAEKGLVRFIEEKFVEVLPAGRNIGRSFERGEATILPDTYPSATAGDAEELMSAEDRYQAAEAALTAEIERLSH